MEGGVDEFEEGAATYPLSSMQEFSKNYMAAGGKRAFSEYYRAKYDNAIFSSRLRDRIVFSKHNLVSDSSFNEFNVIFCRNVLIYFNETLQTHVHNLLHQSLCRFGVLVLGSNETTQFSSIAKHYKTMDDVSSIFQRRQ